jgi:magnesium transporter
MKKISFHSTDTQLSKVLKNFHGYDLANMLDSMTEEQIVRILDLVNTNILIDIFNEYHAPDYLLDIVSDDLKKKILNNVETDELKYFFEEEERREKYFPYLSKIRKVVIQSLLKYDDDLAASIMTTDFITIKISTSIKDATKNTIKNSTESDYIDTLFIIDESDNYIGQIDIKDLIVARIENTLADILIDDRKTIDENTTIEEAIGIVQNYDLKAVPVLQGNKIIGIITQNDIYEELVEYQEETFNKLVQLPYSDRQTSVFKRVYTRLPWLLLSVVLNLLIASFLTIFQETLVAVIALALFQPMLLGMAGNISTQSLAVTILRLHEKEINHIPVPKKHIINEFLIGLINSAIVSVCTFLFVFILMSFLKFGDKTPIEIAFVVSISMFVSLVVSSFIGVFIPLLCDKFKIDPAAASGPVISTINDLFALFVYFGLATILFVL